MSCHGDDALTDSSGPGAVFDPLFRWPRFVKAGNATSALCPNQKALEELLEKKTLGSLRTNPRYQCIDPKRVTSLNHFHHQMEQFNSRRAAKFMRTTVDYEKFKFLIVGSVACDKITVEEWLPPEEVNKLNAMGPLRGEIKNAKSYEDLKNVANSLLKSQRDAFVRIENKYADDIKKIKANQTFDFQTSTSDAICKSDSELEAQTNFGFAGLERSNIIQLRYHADAIGSGKVKFNSTLDYIFGGRGININGVGRIDNTFWKYLVAAESNNSLLRNILKFPVGDETKIDLNGISGDTHTVCTQLKHASLEAFKGSQARGEERLPNEVYQ